MMGDDSVMVNDGRWSVENDGLAYGVTQTSQETVTQVFLRELTTFPG